MNKKILSMLLLTVISLLVFTGCEDSSTEPSVQSATITEDGGLYEIEDEDSPVYGAFVDIPEGALENNVTVSINEIDQNIPGDSTSIKVSFEPEGTTFKEAVEIGIPVQDGMDLNSCRIYYFDPIDHIQKELKVKRIDREKRVVIAEVRHFSIYSANDDGLSFDMKMYNLYDKIVISSMIRKTQNSLSHFFSEIPTRWYNSYNYANALEYLESSMNTYAEMKFRLTKVVDWGFDDVVAVKTIRIHRNWGQQGNTYNVYITDDNNTNLLKEINNNLSMEDDIFSSDNVVSYYAGNYISVAFDDLDLTIGDKYYIETEWILEGNGYSGTLRYSADNEVESCKLSNMQQYNPGNDKQLILYQIAKPEVSTNTASNIETSSAQLRGIVTNDGEAEITEKGFYWGTTASNVTEKKACGDGTGSYSSNLNGLDSDKTYYFKSYAINIAGTSYGAVMSFKTEVAVVQPEVTTDAATNIGANIAKLNGAVTDDGGADVTERGFYWGESASNLSNKRSSGNGTGSFSSYISGLTSSKSYYYKSYATNTAGTTYGAVKNFTTEMEITKPQVTTDAANNIGTETARLNGIVTDDGGADVTERGFYWGYSASNLPNTKICGDGTGSYSSNLSYLTSNNTYYFKAYAINSAGITYGAIKSFKTILEISEPQVTTIEASNIGITSAQLNGDVTDNGGADVTERGFYWGTTASDLSNKKTSGNGTGVYSSNLSGLTGNKTYYFKSYAINSAGTSYGIVRNFTTQLEISEPQVITIEASNIGLTSAQLNGDVTDNGADVTERGFYWGATASDLSNKKTSGNGTGVYSSNLSGLTGNKTYYFKSYAINSVGTSYGAVKSFTTQLEISTPQVTTNQASNVGITSARLNAEITDNGGAEITERGFYWGTVQGDYSHKDACGTGTGEFSLDLNGLTGSTTYYFMAYADNSATSSCGLSKNFITSTEISTPQVTTNEASDVESNSVQLNGGITDDGVSEITERGFYWGTVQGDFSHKAPSGTGTGEYSLNLSGLTGNTTYYFMAYADNSATSSCGTVKSFKTLQEISLPQVTTDEASNVGSNSVQLNGEVTDNGGADVTERGFYWGTSSDDLTSKKTSENGTGSFSSDLEGLSSNTTYYFKAYAINSKGIEYGIVKSFTTREPTLITYDASEVTFTTAVLKGRFNCSNWSHLYIGFRYGTSESSLSEVGLYWVAGGNIDYNYTLENLNPNTTYYFQTYITSQLWEQGTGGSIKSFTTKRVGTVTPTELVLVEGGTFIMGDRLGNGSSDETPTHEVTLSSFYIGKYEVTQADYQGVMGSNPSSFEGDNKPVEKVTWYNAVAYCNVLSIADGFEQCYTINGSDVICDFTKNGYRLPTEAEWEYASRGGVHHTDNYEYAGTTDNLADYAWYNSNSGSTTHEVGTKLANQLEIHDMSGNVNEWCNDWYARYSSDSQTNPEGPSSGSYRVLRGGSWNYDSSYTRVVDRTWSDSPYFHFRYVGFRVVRRP